MVGLVDIVKLVKKKALICPSCKEYPVFFPAKQDEKRFVVWCSDMGHWAGYPEQCLIKLEDLMDGR